jgi:hypothetical protein
MSTVLIRDRNPINQRFEGSHFHHLHINNNHVLGIYIPDEIHLKNNHANWKYDKAALRRINNAALIWLCEQDTIEGDHFDPNAKGTYVQVKDSELVNLPTVKKETRADLNRIKARREDKDLNTTLEYLIELDATICERFDKMELEETKERDNK